MSAGTVVTFYSYKGGVGRTLALANIGVLLAKWGYRVLAVDWDLEGPGLHLYYDRWIGEPRPGPRQRTVRPCLAAAGDHGARSVVMTDRIIGCSYKEGIDYPEGQVCPQCPFWAHRDRWSGDMVQ